MTLGAPKTGKFTRSVYGVWLNRKHKENWLEYRRYQLGLFHTTSGSEDLSCSQKFGKTTNYINRDERNIWSLSWGNNSIRLDVFPIIYNTMLEESYDRFKLPWIHLDEAFRASFLSKNWDEYKNFLSICFSKNLLNTEFSAGYFILFVLSRNKVFN